MNIKTQTLIIDILGIYAIISLIGIFTLIALTNYDNNIILALIPITTSPISILGGFIAGKTVYEKEAQDNNHPTDEETNIEETETEYETTETTNNTHENKEETTNLDEEIELTGA